MKRAAGSQDIDQMLKSRLRERGYRLTPQRLEIIRFWQGTRHILQLLMS